MLKIVIAASVVLGAGALIATHGAPTDPSLRPAASLVSYHDAHINAHLEGLVIPDLLDYSLVYPIASNQKQSDR
jgi:hypothetical protein